MQKQNRLSIYKDMQNFAPPSKKKGGGVSNFFAKVFLFPNTYVQLKRQTFGHY